MRKFSFKLPTQVQLERIEMADGVNTFGQMKQTILANRTAADKFKWSEVVFIEKNTKAMFGSIDDAVLPAGNLLFFVTPNKTKSGVDINVDNILHFSYTTVHTFLWDLSHVQVINLGDSINEQYDANLDTDMDKENVIGEILGWHYNEAEAEVGEEPVVEETADVKENILGAIALLDKAILGLGTVGEVDGMTMSELHAEAERLRAAIQG